MVRYPAEYRSSIDEIRNIKVGYTTASGANAYIPLSELADISVDTGAAWIYHEGTQRFIPVKFSVRERDLGSTVAEAQEQVARSVKLPSGYRLVWSGEFGQLQAAKERLPSEKEMPRLYRHLTDLALESGLQVAVDVMAPWGVLGGLRVRVGAREKAS